MIEITHGDILRDPSELLVNTVNCVGVMGRGLALQFKQQFPANFHAYRAACEAQEVQPGRVLLHATGLLTGPRWLANFPSKRHWRSPSRMEDIEAGLVSLVAQIKQHDIASVALPPLGCGLGGLPWAEVRTRIEHAFAELPQVRVRLYAPRETPQALPGPPAPDQPPPISAGRAVLVGLMERYQAGMMEPWVTLLELHKLLYFVQEAGEPLRLSFRKAPYGPYADNLRHVLAAVEGHLLVGFNAAGDAPDTPLELVPGVQEQARAVLADAPESVRRYERVGRLVEGFESPFGLELLASVHWLVHREGAREPGAVVAGLHTWNDRKQQFSARQVGLAFEVLREQGWVA